jgi:hypothetical protein
MGGYKVDTYQRFTVLLVANKVKPVVDSSKDSVLLGSPRSAHNSVWELGGAVTQPCCLDLSEETAKLADDVGALEIDGQLLEMTDSVASRAYSMPAYCDLSALAEILSRGGHAGTVAWLAAEQAACRMRIVGVGGPWT